MIELVQAEYKFTNQAGRSQEQRFLNLSTVPDR